jgi:hypothetical protein
LTHNQKVGGSIPSRPTILDKFKIIYYIYQKFNMENIFTEIKEWRERVVNNWNESGLLESLNGMKNKKVFELYESESHHSIDFSDKQPIAFPVIMRILHKLPKDSDIVGMITYSYTKNLIPYDIDETRIMF